MQDIFIEYLVQRQKTPRILLLKILIALAVPLAAISLFALFHSLSPLPFLLTLLAAHGGYSLILSLDIEYEYLVTNGEMDVDCIIARRKRKRLASVDFRQVEAFGRYRPAEHRRKVCAAKILACDSPGSTELWYCVAPTRQKGRTLIVFSANQKMLDAIKPFLPRQIMCEAFRG